jgi:hypothetical protein
MDKTKYLMSHNHVQACPTPVFFSGTLTCWDKKLTRCKNYSMVCLIRVSLYCRLGFTGQLAHINKQTASWQSPIHNKHLSGQSFFCWTFCVYQAGPTVTPITEGPFASNYLKSEDSWRLTISFVVRRKWIVDLSEAWRQLEAHLFFLWDLICHLFDLELL